MLDPKEFTNFLVNHELNFFTGVPCSGFTFLNTFEKRDDIYHISAVNEGNAVAIATGHFLSTGNVPVVYMQNSGLGNAVNPLTSLVDSHVYEIPLLLFISWRGEPGTEDEPQHKRMGEITLSLLKVLRIPHTVLSPILKKAQRQIERAKEKARSENRPVALVFRRGIMKRLPEDRGVSKRGMSREAALEILLKKIGEFPILATTGKTGREVFEIRRKLGQKNRDFLTVGSMGHISGIGLGVVRNSRKRLYVLDGDGSALMHLGAISTVGYIKPKNFVHIILNNNAHDSTGGQVISSRNVSWVQLFSSVGYKSVFIIKTASALNKLDFAKIKGPSAIIVSIKKGARSDLGRPGLTPVQTKDRFMEYLWDKEQIEYSNIEGIKNILKKHSPGRILLVTGRKSFEQSGAKSKLNKLLIGYNISRFYDFETNPKFYDIQRGIKLAKEADLIIAVGGGSVLDVAKAINFLSVQKGEIKGYIEGKKVGEPILRPLVAIPTTAGSGSEATHFAVVYIGKIKHSLTHRSILPDYVILDPSLMSSLPPKQRALSGMDAFTQAVESYWSVNSTPKSKKYAKKAIRLIIKNLEKNVNNPTKTSEKSMQLGANLAGKAINISKTTACHSISYAMTAQFGVPHGQAVGVNLPKILELNSKVTKANLVDPRGVSFVKNSIQDILTIIGAKSVNDAKGVIRELMVSIGLKGTLKDLGIPGSKFNPILHKALTSSRAKNNPRKLLEVDLALDVDNTGVFEKFDNFILEIFRKAAKRTVGIFVKVGIDPVNITWINFIFFGLLPLYLIAIGDIKLHLIAIGMFLVRVYLDYIDGQLARESGKGSDLGAWFDPGSDQIITSILAFAVFWNVYLDGMTTPLLIAGLASLFGHLQISVFSLMYEHTGVYFPSGEKDSLPKFKGGFWDVFIKDFVLIDSAFFKIVGSFKYPLLVCVLLQRLDLFLIYFAFFNNIRWITMMIVYMLALVGKKSKVQLVGLLEKKLDKEFS